MQSRCAHPSVSLLNPWELLRKYVCDDCRAVVTCACTQDLAAYVLPHQAEWGVDPDTQERIGVTEQLVQRVCFECRGIPPPAYPKAPQRGSASVVHHYYWHELWTRTNRAQLAWCRNRGLPLLSDDGVPLLAAHGRRHREEFARIARDVLTEVRAEHEDRPRYDVSRPSDAEILAANDVDVIDLPACYLEPPVDRKVRVMPVDSTDPDAAVSVEEFVARTERAKGREVMFLESRPVQCLFGALMWLWVQDPADERGRVVHFGGRDGLGADENGMIPCILPPDFGTPGHAVRRAEALDAHMAFLPDDTAELGWAYDYWLEPSRALRQYLWAYTQEDEERARTMVEVLGAPRIKQLLSFLAEDYWRRYLGWPDLLTWQAASDGPIDLALVEVKSSGDRLAEDQRTWICHNAGTLRLPFRLVKVHRTERLRRV